MTATYTITHRHIRNPSFLFSLRYDPGNRSTTASTDQISLCQMSLPCPLCARSAGTQQLGPHTRTHNHDLSQFQRQLFASSPERAVISEQQRLLSILRHLMRLTQGHHLTLPLAREVNALKRVLHLAREQGGLAFILAVVCDLEVPIEVCCMKTFTFAHWT